MTMTATRQQATTMKAVVRPSYGSAEALELREIDKPALVDDGVLVRVRAASVNRADWYGLTGRPLIARPMMGLLKPRDAAIGVDFAGTVEAVGKDITELRPGDEVFGARTGAFSEYVCARNAVVAKPANLTFEQAAAAPVAALTALQGLRDKGRLQPGDRVVINGASGGVGTFAIQIAKALGAEVTAVCSTRNVEQARSLGADHVIDYTKEDFTRGDRRYDLLFDNAGTKPWRAYRRVLTPDARFVVVGGPMTNRVLGPLGQMARVWLATRLGRRKAGFFIAKLNKPDLAVLGELLESGTVTPAIERRYELSEIQDAFRYMGEGHARGKLVITV